MLKHIMTEQKTTSMEKGLMISSIPVSPLVLSQNPSLLIVLPPRGDLKNFASRIMDRVKSVFPLPVGLGERGGPRTLPPPGLLKSFKTSHTFYIFIQKLIFAFEVKYKCPLVT